MYKHVCISIKLCESYQLKYWPKLFKFRNAPILLYTVLYSVIYSVITNLLDTTLLYITLWSHRRHKGQTCHIRFSICFAYWTANFISQICCLYTCVSPQLYWYRTESWRAFAWSRLNQHIRRTRKVNFLRAVKFIECSVSSSTIFTDFTVLLTPSLGWFNFTSHAWPETLRPLSSAFRLFQGPLTKNRSHGIRCKLDTFERGI